MGESTTIIAFDQHAASVMAAVLLPGQQTAATQELSSDVAAIGRFVNRVQRQGPVRCCYEAGPCGFELQRYLHAKDVPCEIIAPTLIPRRPGDRIKTDRRDARQLAVLYRAGALTAIHIPTEQEEAARDLLRCREALLGDVVRARHRLSKFLLRHGRRFTAGTAWTQRHAEPACDEHGQARFHLPSDAVIVEHSLKIGVAEGLSQGFVGGHNDQLVETVVPVRPLDTCDPYPVGVGERSKHAFYPLLPGLSLLLRHFHRRAYPQAGSSQKSPCAYSILVIRTQ